MARVLITGCATGIGRAALTRTSPLPASLVADLIAQATEPMGDGLAEFITKTVHLSDDEYEAQTMTALGY